MEKQKNSYSVIGYMNNNFNSLLESYMKKHSKTFFVRADVHFPSEYGSVNGNKNIIKCIAKAVQKLKRNGYDPAYAWVREQNISEHPHYHLFFLLDGKKTRSSGMVFDTLNQFWKSTSKTEKKGLINYCYQNKYGKKYENGLVISRKEGIPDSVYRQIGYMSKPYSKGERKDGLRNFGMSRLPKSSS